MSKVNPGAAEKKIWLCEWRNPGVESGHYDPLYVKVQDEIGLPGWAEGGFTGFLTL